MTKRYLEDFFISEQMISTFFPLFLKTFLEHRFILTVILRFISPKGGERLDLSLKF